MDLSSKNRLSKNSGNLVILKLFLELGLILRSWPQGYAPHSQLMGLSRTALGTSLGKPMPCLAQMRRVLHSSRLWRNLKYFTLFSLIYYSFGLFFKINYKSMPVEVNLNKDNFERNKKSTQYALFWRK